jgi:hypothetical protein
LKQRLGDRENALAAEFLPVAELEILNFSCKGSLSHVISADEKPRLRNDTKDFGV